MAEEQEKKQDYEGGYGGGRQRVETAHEHAFGERGVADKGGSSQPEQPDKDLPEGVKDTGGGPGWQERFAAENAKKYGQAGGQPIVQRGPSQSAGGEEHKEQGLGDTRDVSARGAYGTRETEDWPDPPADDSKDKGKR